MRHHMSLRNRLAAITTKLKIHPERWIVGGVLLCMAATVLAICLVNGKPKPKSAPSSPRPAASAGTDGAKPASGNAATPAPSSASRTSSALGTSSSWSGRRISPVSGRRGEEACSTPGASRLPQRSSARRSSPARSSMSSPHSHRPRALPAGMFLRARHSRSSSRSSLTTSCSRWLADWLS